MATNPSGRPKKAPSFCSNCGAQVTNAGRASKDGKRFCRQPRCQAVKSARHRARIAASKESRPAPSSCHHCGTDLPSREWRAGDETGRFCRKVTCRRARDKIRSEAGLEQVPGLIRKVELLENGIALLADAVMADNEHVIGSGRRVCRECGLDSALSGWVHLASDGGTPCWGTLDGMARRPVQSFHLGLAWPARREYLTADQLEAFTD